MVSPKTFQNSPRFVLPFQPISYISRNYKVWKKLAVKVSTVISA